MVANCELMVGISFRFEQDSMQDVLMQHYENFCKDFADAGCGGCGPPKILLPQSVEIEGAQVIIDGEFGFDCELSLADIASGLGKIKGSFKDMDPKPRITVTLHNRDSHDRIRLYPHSDVEFHLSGL